MDQILMLKPWLGASAGGALFGAAAGLLLVGAGRIAGVGGIAAGLLQGKRNETLWRALFIVGLLAGGLLSARLLPHSFVWHRDVSMIRVATAGLLIGIGARVGNGCTSGHGICGIGRLSVRSFVAVPLFTLFGALTHWLDLHASGVLS